MMKWFAKILVNVLVICRSTVILEIFQVKLYTIAIPTKALKLLQINYAFSDNVHILFINSDCL